jgi:hypothetical protein
LPGRREAPGIVDSLDVYARELLYTASHPTEAGMIQLRKFTLALPFAFAVAACSSKKSSGDTGTAAGSIGNDTAAVRTDTNPVPGAIPGSPMDTGKKVMPMDSMMKDSAKMDSMARRHHAAKSKKTKKPY